MREPEFTVEDIFVIKDRGPVITRSRKRQQWPGRDEPGSFNTGDWIECGSLRVQITGLEYHCIPGPLPQQGMLLRGVEREQLEVGQTWTRWQP